MSITLTVDMSGFNRSVKELSAVVNKDLHVVMRDEMRLLVERLVQLTPPPHGRGGANEAKKTGENAVQNDLKRLFFWEIQTKGGQTVPVANPGIVDSAWHQTMRDRRGRVRRPQERKPVSKADFIRYFKTIAGHVGKAKAGWNAAAVRFKARAIPAWVKRHGTADGASSEVWTPRGGVLEARNSNKAIGVLNQEARILRTAIATRERDIKSKIRQIISKNARKFSRRIRV